MSETLPHILATEIKQPTDVVPAAVIATFCSIEHRRPYRARHARPGTAAPDMSVETARIEESTARKGQQPPCSPTTQPGPKAEDSNG